MAQPSRAFTPAQLRLPLGQAPASLREGNRCSSRAVGLRASLNDPVGMCSRRQIWPRRLWARSREEHRGVHVSPRFTSCVLFADLQHTHVYTRTHTEGGADGSLEKILGNIGLGKVGKGIDWFFDTSTTHSLSVSHYSTNTHSHPPTHPRTHIHR